MAFIGMLHPVVARLKDHTAGSEPTYEKGMVIGHAMQGNLNITRNNNPLYGDDVVVEDDNGITAMELEMGLDDIEEVVRVYMLSLQEKTDGVSGNAQKEYLDTDASAPYVGVGYIRVRKKKGVLSYQTVWYYKSMFSEESESSATKKESIEWQTPTLKGRIMALDVDGRGYRAFRKKALFPNEAEAVAWLDKQANIAAAEVLKAAGGAGVPAMAAEAAADAAAIAEAVAASTALKTATEAKASTACKARKKSA